MSIETSQPQTIVSFEPLPQLLQQTFGTRVEVTGCQIGKRRHDYLVLLLQLRHPSVEVVVKLGGPEAPLACPFERTAMLHRLVATHTTIPMPEILAADTSCQRWPWRYMIKRHIPGQEWAVAAEQMTPEALADAYRQIGHAVAQLHAIRFPSFGELAVDGSVQGDRPHLAALAEHACAIIQTARLRDLFLSVLDQRQALFLNVGDASLCHEDLHKYNILFEYQQGRWRLATILDFEKAWAGHHETDLARLELWQGMTSPGFWEAYEAVHRVEPLYTERRPIYQLLWCFEFARPTAEHLADTQGLCEELGLARFEGFD